MKSRRLVGVVSLVPLLVPLLLLAACAASHVEPECAEPTFTPLFDEQAFYCDVHPLCIVELGCAAGAECHSERSALRLSPMTEVAECVDGRLVGTPPPGAAVDFQAVQFTAARETERSPLYRRPTGLDLHPVVSFDPGHPCEDIILDWVHDAFCR